VAGTFEKSLWVHHVEFDKIREIVLGSENETIEVSQDETFMDLLNMMHMEPVKTNHR
jgi:hypothetical protein